LLFPERRLDPDSSNSSRLDRYCSRFDVLCAPQAIAQPLCGLSLVLALDVSSSVDDEEFALQTRGLAAALRDPAVRSSIVAAGGVQAMALEWSGRRQQVDVTPWSLLSFDDDIFAFADRIEAINAPIANFPQRWVMRWVMRQPVCAMRRSTVPAR
jgi:hypothetical protein